MTSVTGEMDTEDVHIPSSRRTLTDADLSALTAYFASVSNVELTMHREHHEFVSAWIEREKRKQETWERIQAQVGGWAIIGFIGGVGLAVWDWVKAHLK